MFDKSSLSKQDRECLEMFEIFTAGATNELLLKVNVKKWEYVLYGGRPEFYPEDRKALLTLLMYSREKAEHEHKRMEAQQRMKDRRAGRL